MSTTLLSTKLYIPLPRPKLVLRQQLIERLEAGLERKLTLISAPAGFGKTTLLSDWLAASGKRAAWLAVDDGDSDPKRFLTYFVAALRTIDEHIGQTVLAMLQAPQPSIEGILTALVNDISTIKDEFILVLDDYHLIDTSAVDKLLSFLLDYLPPQFHLLISSREDPQLPLARLRARNQLSELRVSDLRFSLDEAAQFLNNVMGLKLSKAEVSALENRTEGWIAGLQLAAISLQGHQDSSAFIESFTGSHHFVLDYLLEEVLHQQSEYIQSFLLQSSILERLSGSLCDAVMLDAKGQETLEYFERANLFIVPLDKERRWYRYHHLFAELLRQRLQHTGTNIPELHMRASQWYEANGLEIEAFQHAAAANDIDTAIRLIEGEVMPLPFRGAVIPVLNWLESLPKKVLDSRPILWAWFGSVLLAAGQPNNVEQKVQAAEAALEGAEENERNRDIIGRLAAVRATHAAGENQIERIISQSKIALEYLHPQNLAFRTSTMWKLGFAHHMIGERAAARNAYNEVIKVGEASRNVIFTAVALIGLGNLQEKDKQLHLAVETFQRSLKYFGEAPLPMAHEALLGLARIYYEWNDLETAEKYAQQSAQLAKLSPNSDKLASTELFRVRLKLAQGDDEMAYEILAKVAQLIHEGKFVYQMQELLGLQVHCFLREGNLKAAIHVADNYEIPTLSRARIFLAQGNHSAALALLAPLRQEMEAKNWADEVFKTMLLQSMAYHAAGDKDNVLNVLAELLPVAEQGAFIRSFLDEGQPMAALLSEALRQGISPVYSSKILSFFEVKANSQPLIEPLSERELEILRLIADGLSNQDISEKLFLALSTVKGHNQSIFGKLQVQRRTEAVARSRELGLL